MDTSTKVETERHEGHEGHEAAEGTPKTGAKRGRPRKPLPELDLTRAVVARGKGGRVSHVARVGALGDFHRLVTGECVLVAAGEAGELEAVCGATVAAPAAGLLGWSASDMEHAPTCPKCLTAWAAARFLAEASAQQQREQAERATKAERERAIREQELEGARRCYLGRRVRVEGPAVVSQARTAEGEPVASVTGTVRIVERDAAGMFVVVVPEGDQASISAKYGHDLALNLEDITIELLDGPAAGLAVGPPEVPELVAPATELVAPAEADQPCSGGTGTAGATRGAHEVQAEATVPVTNAVPERGACAAEVPNAPAPPAELDGFDVGGLGRMRLAGSVVVRPELEACEGGAWATIVLACGHETPLRSWHTRETVLPPDDAPEGAEGTERIRTRDEAIGAARAEVAGVAVFSCEACCELARRAAPALSGLEVSTAERDEARAEILRRDDAADAFLLAVGGELTARRERRLAPPRQVVGYLHEPRTGGVELVLACGHRQDAGAEVSVGEAARAVDQAEERPCPACGVPDRPSEVPVIFGDQEAPAPTVDQVDTCPPDDEEDPGAGHTCDAHPVCRCLPEGADAIDRWGSSTCPDCGAAIVTVDAYESEAAARGRWERRAAELEAERDEAIRKLQEAWVEAETLRRRWEGPGAALVGELALAVLAIAGEHDACALCDVRGPGEHALACPLYAVPAEDVDAATWIADLLAGGRTEAAGEHEGGGTTGAVGRGAEAGRDRRSFSGDSTGGRVGRDSRVTNGDSQAGAGTSGNQGVPEHNKTACAKKVPRGADGTGGPGATGRAQRAGGSVADRLGFVAGALRSLLGLELGAERAPVIAHVVRSLGPDDLLAVASAVVADCGACGWEGSAAERRCPVCGGLS